MLPENEMTGYAPLAEPRTVRLRFGKTGPLQYISHLDLQRTFGRILARADLPLWFTQGFNPHPKLVFALPLPIGCESVCELADIRIVRDMPCDEIMKRMNAASVSSLRFFGCYIPERKFQEIAYAGYTLSFGVSSPEDAERAEKLLSTPPLYVVKHSKSGDRETDIIPLIKEARFFYENHESERRLRCELILSSSESATLSPLLVVSAMQRELGLPADNSYSLTRRELFDEKINHFE